MATGNGIEQNDGHVHLQESEFADHLYGRVLNNRFTLLGPIGAGGMGTVYRAVQSPLDRVVAIKILNPNHANAQGAGFRQRFFLEASLTSKLRHPNTITVFDYGETADGIFFIVMEYLEGEPLSRLLSKVGSLHWTRCFHIAQQVCRSLREAHKLNIIHRDLKPANVMLLTEDGEDLAKVLDFGLVKSFIEDGASSRPDVSDARMLLGSPTYMAPEQARNHADHRSDIYSLGVMLYHMLVGRPPFVAKDAIDVIFKHMTEPPPPMNSIRPDLEFGRDVEELVRKCLEKQPLWRFQSMDDVLDALRRAAGSSGVTALSGQDPTESPQLPASAAEPHSKAAKAPESSLAIEISVVPEKLRALARRRTLVAGSILLASVLIAFLATVVLGGRRPGQTARLASAQLRASPTDQPPMAQNLPKLVRFHISTDPAGANVSLNGQSLGPTPLSFELPQGPSGAANAELSLTLKGYHPMKLIAGGSGPDVVLTQRLQRKKLPDRVATPAAIARPIETERGQEEEPVATKEPVAIELAPEQSSTGTIAAAATSMPGGSGGAGGGPLPSPTPRIELDESKVRLAKIYGPDPDYTPEAINHDIHGVMVVKCLITVKGAVRDCQVIQSLPFMDRAVVHALERRRYQPYLSNGQPVEVEYTFKINLEPPQ
jgi:serine/threonine-protein kinase